MAVGRTIFSYEWLSARIVADAVRRIASLYGSGRILDVGCGEKPYRNYFSGAANYVGLEHPDTIHSRNVVDIFGSADALPFHDGSFDVVLSFEVLEHLEKPQEAITEMSRVLRPGGHAVVFVPFIYHLHEFPRDFFRYTPYGLQELFKNAGLQTVSIEPSSGYWVTSSILACNYLEKFQKLPFVRPIIAVVIAAIQLVGLGLEKIVRGFERGVRIERFSYHYVAVARRVTG